MGANSTHKSTIREAIVISHPVSISSSPFSTFAWNDSQPVDPALPQLHTNPLLLEKWKAFYISSNSWEEMESLIHKPLKKRIRKEQSHETENNKSNDKNKDVAPTKAVGIDKRWQIN